MIIVNILNRKTLALYQGIINRLVSISISAWAKLKKPDIKSKIN